MIKNIGLVYTLVLLPDADVELDFQAKYSMQFTDIIIVQNVESLSIYVNGNLVSSSLALQGPIIVNANDSISLVTTRDSSQTSKFELIGNTLN